MAYSYPNITGKEIKRNGYTYQAVAEDELSGSFDTLEDCALTSLTVIVKDEKGEQIATVDLDAAFCFYENAAGVERYSYDYNETDRGIHLASHDWNDEETTTEDLQALETAAGGGFTFWQGVNAAADDVCEALEPAVRALRVEDSNDSGCYNVPTYALPYLINADPSGLSDEEIAAVDEWYAGLAVEGLSFTLDCVDSEAAPYFSSCPAFGLPAECQRVAVKYFPDL